MSVQPLNTDGRAAIMIKINAEFDMVVLMVLLHQCIRKILVIIQLRCPEGAPLKIVVKGGLQFAPGTG